MRKLIVVAIGSLSLLLTALPVYAACSGDQVNACTNQSNTCSSGCNFIGAGESCYAGCVCGYYSCMTACGNSMPNCGPARPPALTGGSGGEYQSVFSGTEVEVNASPKDCRLAAGS
jgi:hypothetical protein